MYYGFLNNVFFMYFENVSCLFDLITPPSTHFPSPPLSSRHLSGHAEDAVWQLCYEPPAGGQWLPQTELGYGDMQKVKQIHIQIQPDIANENFDKHVNTAPVLSLLVLSQYGEFGQEVW